MIVAYVGLPGSGKTYRMAQDMTRERKRGRPIFANFPLIGARGFSDLKQVLNVRKGIIGADELNVLCPARQWRNIPTDYLLLWTQSRKMGIDFWYTTQSFKRVDVSIRSITNYVWYCKRIFGRWHRAYLLDAGDAERERFRAYIKVKDFLIRESVYKTYDTYKMIMPADHVRDRSVEGFNPNDLPVFDDSLTENYAENILHSGLDQGPETLRVDVPDVPEGEADDLPGEDRQLPDVPDNAASDHTVC